jgi:hypothetical protein
VAAQPKHKTQQLQRRKAQDPVVHTSTVTHIYSRADQGATGAHIDWTHTVCYRPDTRADVLLVVDPDPKDWEMILRSCC